MNYKSILQVFVFLIICSSLSAQTHSAVYKPINNNIKSYYEYLPEGYNEDTSYSFPLIIFSHGRGEIGNDKPLSSVLKNGIPKLINQGKFPNQFIVNKDTFKFIVISPQYFNWPSGNDLTNVIDYAEANYKVDKKRIYLTGLSMGGAVTWNNVEYSIQNAKRIAAIVPVCGASFPKKKSGVIICAANLPVWATHNRGDPIVLVNNTLSYISSINNSTNSSITPAKKTIFEENNHNAWSRTYDLSFKENNMNIYEWMLQFERDID